MLFSMNADTTKSVPTADTEIMFDQFWGAYPKRLGSNPKAPARAKFMTAVRRGSDPQKIIAGAQAYAREAKVGTEFVCMAVTWLNQRRWEDYDGQQRSPIGADAAARLIEKYRQRRLREGWS